jgi:hypothetical protein
MRQSNHSAARVLAPAMPAKRAPGDPLFAAHEVLKLLSHVRFVMVDAQQQASDGRLGMIARWIGERIDSLDEELLPELTATVKALEAAAKEAAAKAVKP